MLQCTKSRYLRISWSWCHYGDIATEKLLFKTFVVKSDTLSNRIYEGTKQWLTVNTAANGVHIIMWMRFVLCSCSVGFGSDRSYPWSSDPNHLSNLLSKQRPVSVTLAGFSVISGTVAAIEAHPSVMCTWWKYIFKMLKIKLLYILSIKDHWKHYELFGKSGKMFN